MSEPGSRYAKSGFAGETRVRPQVSKPLTRSGMTRFHDGPESLKPSRSRPRLGFASGRARGAPSGSRACSKFRQAWWRKAMLAIGGRIRRSRRRRASIGAGCSRPSISALSVQRQRLETGYGSARCAHAIALQIGLIRASDRVYAPYGLNPPAWHPSSSSVPILSGTGAPRFCGGALPSVCVFVRRMSACASLVVAGSCSGGRPSCSCPEQRAAPRWLAHG